MRTTTGPWRCTGRPRGAPPPRDQGDPVPVAHVRDVPAPVVLPAGLLPQPGRRRDALGDYAQALADFDTALRLDPTYYQAINDRAWVFATAADPAFRDPVESLANATRACEMTDWKNPWTLDVLAAAYADRGNFAKAIYTEQEALAICKGTEYWVPGIAPGWRSTRRRRPTG